MDQNHTNTNNNQSSGPNNNQSSGSNASQSSGSNTSQSPAPNTNQSSGSNSNQSPAPIKAIIIDDEPLARLIVREFLQTYTSITIVQECCDGFEGIKAIQQHHPDLIFLDIQMPKINGFEMLELVEDPPAVIFTTAFDEYAIRAFETHAVDYLLKPFSKERFDKALAKWLDQHTSILAAKSSTAGFRSSSPASSSASSSSSSSDPFDPSSSSDPSRAPNPAPSPFSGSSSIGDSSSPIGSSSTPGSGTGSSLTKSPSSSNTQALLETASQSPAQAHRIVVKTGGKIKIIPVEDIHYLEASDDYVKIHTHNGAFLKNKTMSWFEQSLDPAQFVRTHRSYILNVQQVTRIEPYEKDGHLCILQSGGQVPVSKTGYVKLKSVLGL